MRIALAGIPEAIIYSKDDPALAAALERQGAEVARVDWREPAVDWASFDLVAIRTTWDYHLKWAEFNNWLERVLAVSNIVNPPDLVRWNANKRYLKELESAGARIVPTEVVDSMPNPREGEWVVKPTLGATAYQTKRGVWADVEAQLAEIVAERPALLQPFVPSVVDRGEISLVFVNGELQTAMLKRPAPGDFRVQNDHGGTFAPTEARSDEMENARRALAAIPSDYVYARVDMVDLPDGTPAVMELELIEPELFLFSEDRVADNMARALIQRAQGYAGTS